MSAVPEHFMGDPDESRDREIPSVTPTPVDDEEEAEERFWQWVALVVLLACWLAEASMCGNG